MAADLKTNNTIKKEREKYSQELKDLAKFLGNADVKVFNYVGLFFNLILTCGLISFCKSVLNKYDEKNDLTKDKIFYKFLFGKVDNEATVYSSFYQNLSLHLMDDATNYVEQLALATRELGWHLGAKKPLIEGLIKSKARRDLYKSTLKRHMMKKGTTVCPQDLKKHYQHIKKQRKEREKRKAKK